MEAGDAAQNGAVLPALTVAALLKEIGEQGVDSLVDVGALGMAGQKDPILSGQRAAAAEDLILLHGQLGQLRGVGRDGGHLAVLVLCAAPQGSNLGVQRSKLLQKFFYHSVFLPPAWSCSSWMRVARSSLRGTTLSTKPCSSWNSLRWKPSGRRSPMVCSMTRG